MTNLDFNKLLISFQENYYLLVVLTVTEVVAFTIALIYVRKDRIGKYFIFYIGFDLAVLLADFYLVMNENIDQNLKDKFYVIANTTVSLVELIIYFKFFNSVFSSKAIKSLLRILQYFYIFLIFIY